MTVGVINWIGITGYSFRENNAMCLACRESKEIKYEDIAYLCKEILFEITKMDLFDTCGVYPQDCTKLKVSGHLKFDEVKGCNFHYGDKIGGLAIGELTRSSDKEFLDPFVESVKLIEKFQGMSAKYINNFTN